MQLTCDAILFDLDGVLVDSSACIERHWRQWAEEHGLELASILSVAHGRRTLETMRLIAPELDCVREAEKFAAQELDDLEGVLGLAGASQLLKQLPRDAWAIVTSTGSDLARARLQHAGLPMPPLLVCAEDVKQGKPAPEAYLLGAARMRISPENCIVVEDSPSGIEAAQRAGMRVIAVLTTHVQHLPGGGELVVDDLRGLKVSRRYLGGRRLSIEIAER